MFREDIADRISVTGLKRHQCGVDDTFIFAREFFGNDSFQLLGIETENFRDQSENENVFAFVLSSAAERFHRQSGDGHADIHEAFVVEVRLDVVGIVKEDSAFLEEAEVVLITVLIERDQKVGFVTGR